MAASPRIKPIILQEDTVISGLNETGKNSRIEEIWTYVNSLGIYIQNDL